jgi:hypothetical protein
LKKVSEDHRLKDLEKDKVINDLRASLEVMKRKAEQGSMETQGEVLEQEFEAQLRGFFVHDDIQPVPKGIRGADLIQTVRTPIGAECGVLLWETKNTKAWSNNWIPKLKDDMIEIRASIAILVSVVLPAGINRFGHMDGVWVSDPLCALPLAAALRGSWWRSAASALQPPAKARKWKRCTSTRPATNSSRRSRPASSKPLLDAGPAQQGTPGHGADLKQYRKEIKRVIKNTAGLYGDMQDHRRPDPGHHPGPGTRPQARQAAARRRGMPDELPDED